MQLERMPNATVPLVFGAVAEYSFQGKIIWEDLFT